MPELPDVEVFRQYLNATSLHQRIDGVDVDDEDMLNGVSKKKLKGRLRGHWLESSRRHGKYLFAQCSSSHWLVLHFGMTGFLKYFKDPKKQPAHVRLLIHFSNGYHLAYDCQRKLGEIALADDPDGFVKERGLGPDALDPKLGLEEFREILRRSRGTIKGALMNQEMIAGIGNIYADEILFQARIHPKARTGDLTKGQLGELFRTMREKVLPTAVDRRADPAKLPRSFFIPRREEQGSCPRCGHGVAQIRISGRSTYLCPSCQEK